MKCSQTERNIYLYDELTARERAETDQHVKTCASCNRIMERVMILQNLLKSHQLHTPPVANHAQMTSRVMNALDKVVRRKKATWSWLASDLKMNALRYGMATLSLFLAVMFISEFSSGSDRLKLAKHYRLTPGEKTELNLARFNTAFLEWKKRNHRPSMLLSDCVNKCLSFEDPGCKECSNKFAKPFLEKYEDI